MKQTLLAMVLAGTMIPVASGSDREGNYHTVGGRTCDAFLKVRQDKGVSGALRNAAWVGGYLSAYNRLQPDTVNILGATDLDGALAWIENWCRANPRQGEAKALEALTEALYPRRHKTLKDTGR